MARILNNLFGLFSRDMAIDLGTANICIFVKGKGVVVQEPAVVAVRTDKSGKKNILAVGSEAKRMLGRTPGNVTAVRPMKDGVIADFEITSAMLKHFISLVHGSRKFIRPRIIICVPTGITQVEKRAVQESAENAGAREVYLIEEAIAAAVGAGLPITEPTSNMIVDIGGGTTEVAVISLAGTVYSRATKVGGDHMDEAIKLYVKQSYNLLIGSSTAEEIKMNLGSVWGDTKEEMAVKGRDMVSGIPKTIQITSGEIRKAISEQVEAIVQAVLLALEQTPPELSADIMERGVVLTGGGSLIKGLDQLLKESTSLPVTVVEDPMNSVVIGAGKALDNIELLRELLLN
ncbi:MAG: rod shape-determining protein [Desulfovibrionales bacterium]